MHTVFAWFKSLNAFAFVIVMLILTAGVTLPLEYFASATQDESIGPEALGKLLEFPVYVVVLGPFLETVIFQWAPIRFMRNNFQLGKAKSVLLSALPFGLIHAYSPLYVLAAFCMGLLLAFGFLVRDVGRGHALWLIALVHGLNNGATLLFAR